MLRGLLFTLVFVALACAVKKDIFQPGVSFDSVLDEWVPKRVAGDLDRVTLYIGAKQQNLDKLDVGPNYNI